MNSNVIPMSAKTAIEQSIAAQITNNADRIAKALASGKDVEIRKIASGISVSAYRKNVIVR